MENVRLFHVWYYLLRGLAMLICRQSKSGSTWLEVIGLSWIVPHVPCGRSGVNDHDSLPTIDRVLGKWTQMEKTRGQIKQIRFNKPFRESYWMG